MASGDRLLVLRMVEEQLHRDADDDRPVREGRTPAAHLRDGELEYRTCPYPGSRLGRPMNVSALRQMGARWDEIVDALAWLRVVYTEARGAYGPDLMDLWRVSQLGSALPWFYILRALDARAPAYAAALSKVTLGTGIMTQRLYVEQLADRPRPVELTAAGLLAGAEATGTLVGETEACAASEKMILNFLDVLIEPGRTFAGLGEVAALAASRDLVLGFGAHYIALKHVLWVSFLARRFLYADVRAAIGPNAELQALIDAPCEPPDFFTVGPGDMAAIALDHRAQWLRSLADLLVPLAPDGSDILSRDAARALAAALGDAPADAAVAAEVQGVLGVDPAASQLVTRALVTYGRIDALLAVAVDSVEAGFRRALDRSPAGAPDAPLTRIDAAARDRLVISSPRRLFASFAPRSFAGLCIP